MSYPKLQSYLRNYTSIIELYETDLHYLMFAVLGTSMLFPVINNIEFPNVHEENVATVSSSSFISKRVGVRKSSLSKISQ